MNCSRFGAWKCLLVASLATTYSAVFSQKKKIEWSTQSNECIPSTSLNTSFSVPISPWHIVCQVINCSIHAPFNLCYKYAVLLYCVLHEMYMFIQAFKRLLRPATQLPYKSTQQFEIVISLLMDRDTLSWLAKDAWNYRPLLVSRGVVKSPAAEIPSVHPTIDSILSVHCQYK